MKVKFIKPHPAYGYFPGETGEVNDKQAEKLIKEGFAEKVAAKKEKDGNDLGAGKGVDPNQKNDGKEPEGGEVK